MPAIMIRNTDRDALMGLRLDGAFPLTVDENGDMAEASTGSDADAYWHVPMRAFAAMRDAGDLRRHPGADMALRHVLGTPTQAFTAMRDVSEAQARMATALGEMLDAIEWLTVDELFAGLCTCTAEARLMSRHIPAMDPVELIAAVLTDRAELPVTRHLLNELVNWVMTESGTLDEDKDREARRWLDEWRELATRRPDVRFGLCRTVQGTAVEWPALREVPQREFERVRVSDEPER